MEVHKAVYTKPEPGEEVVISGISGRFPGSDNVKVFEKNLLEKVELVTPNSERWNADYKQIPRRSGKIKNVSKFDASFFGVHPKQAEAMDAMGRMLLEHSYEAIVDAGINPRKLRGTRTAVITGCSFSETEKTFFYEKIMPNGLGLTGCSKALLSNRIAYWLGVHGPSYTIDTACSSTLVGLEQAYNMIRSGRCDAALVTGSNLCLHPYLSLQFARLGVLSFDGYCKVFDDAADGYARSDAVVVVFLQRAKDAKRNYATVIHAMTNSDGFKEQGITFPSTHMQSVLFEEFYEECGLSPTILSYVEAHGTGTKVGDPEEIAAIDKVFCKDRTTPLKIGSVKSSVGHSEPVSGLVSIIKVILAMESKVISPNMNFKTPKKGMRALEEGRLEVVTEPTPWDGGYVGVNCFGFGGVNCHVLLKSNTNEKINGGAPKDNLPRLVVVSGRTEEAVETLLDDIESRPIDAEYISLFHELHATEIQGHLYRGYTIVDPSKGSIRTVEEYSGTRRPICFVYSGMGSQWIGMGEALLAFPVFNQAIQKCDFILKPRGLNIYEILTSKRKDMFDNILHSFVGIAAVQIGLTDLLTYLGIEPDTIIGHSVGELGCAYADGCFTFEETILSAYSRGLASKETELIDGAMAAIGCGYEEIKSMCPPDIDVACHNSSKSCTISGPKKSIEEFVAHLQSKNMFAKEVASGNIAYHSRYIAAAGPKLLAYLKQVITDPKSRSEKWISTSVPQSEWSSELAKLSSAEYHTNNLLSPVLFEESAVLIPKDAIAIEIAPHGLLQAILRRSMPPTVTNVSLMLREHTDNCKVFLQALGKLYNSGVQLQLAKLYPPIEYPVSRGTPTISPLIRWLHTEDWFVPSYEKEGSLGSGEREVYIALCNDVFGYLSGHVIGGRNLLPATEYLVLIWQTLSLIHGDTYSDISVVFEDVKFLRATNVPVDRSIALLLMIHHGTGRFEVVDDRDPIVTGIIRKLTNPLEEKLSSEVIQKYHDVHQIESEDESMTSKDIYKELKLRGYQYGGLFRGLKSASINGTKGHIAWTDNWVTFMDNMMQLIILNKDTRGLFVPTSIEKLVIDTKYHKSCISDAPEDDKFIPAYHYKEWNTVVAGGVEMRNLRATVISKKREMADPVLEMCAFVAHCDNADVSWHEAIRLSAHLALENHPPMVKVRAIELVDGCANMPIEEHASVALVKVLSDLPMLQPMITLLTIAGGYEDADLPESIEIMDLSKFTPGGNSLLAIGYDLLDTGKVEHLKTLLAGVVNGGFILTRESAFDNVNPLHLQEHSLNVILTKRNGQESFVLLRKQEKLAENVVVVSLNNNEFSWLETVQRALKVETEKEVNANVRIIVTAEQECESGILGFVNCLRKEPGGQAVKAVFIQDRHAPRFSIEDPLYAKQLQLDLAINVLRPGNVWGSYRHSPLPPSKPRPVPHAFLHQMVHGDVSSFRWVDARLNSDSLELQHINVMYCAINFKDIMFSTGRLSIDVITKNRREEDHLIGFEYSGYDNNGHPVMGINLNGGFSNVVACDPMCVWPVPEGWTLEDAATVPCVYATCYYALYMNGKMKKGDTVLIHAGSGGVGQAAIHLALYEGCEVFTTVSTPEKRRFIRETFPSIDDEHIGNSRNTSFEQMIRQKTNGRGVDIVLNSLAEDKLQASLRCMATKGRFLEIGKFDAAANNSIGMEIFLKEVSLYGVMLDNMLQMESDDKAVLKSLLNDGLANGAIKPLPRTVFKRDELESALRYMAAGKHIGKVLLQIHEDKASLYAPIPSLPRFNCYFDRSYVIIGGLGGFGLELADWLVLRGAKYLILVSRNGITNGYQQARTELWKSYGVEISIIIGLDLSTKKDCEFLLRSAEQKAPVDAIFNVAVVLKDNICTKQTPESFEESFKPKAWATKNLDEVSRKLCPKLQHFVVFSSISCGRGNAEQTNYGMSNSVMERVCENRLKEGFPGVAIQWGAVGQVGLLAHLEKGDKSIVIGGTLQQSISSCLKVLDNLLLQKNSAIVGSMVVAEKRTGRNDPNSIVNTILNIMGLKDLKGISHQLPLAELGMDSIMAVEIKQTLEQEFDVILSAQDIRNLNFAKVISMTVQEKAIMKGEEKGKEEGADNVHGIATLLFRTDIRNTHSEICVNLPTAGEENKYTIFFLPGIEDLANIFYNLSPKLKFRAICLQAGINNDANAHNTITDMVNYRLPHVLENLKDEQNFVLVGYSMGALIAIELAKELEALGLSGQLILIDGSPELMTTLTKQSVQSNAEIEHLILHKILKMYNTSANVSEFVLDLNKCQSWEERLDTLSTYIPLEKLETSRESYKILATNLYKRIQSLLIYDVSAVPSINSSILLLKAATSLLPSIAQDYGLRKVTQGNFEVHVIPSDHFTILNHEMVAAAINNVLLEDDAC